MPNARLELDNPKAVAVRLVAGLTLPLKILPAVTLTPELRPGQNAKCISVGQGEGLAPVSTRIFRAQVSFNPDFSLGAFSNGSYKRKKLVEFPTVYMNYCGLIVQIRL